MAHLNRAVNQGKVPPEIGEKNGFHQTDGRFKSLLKKSYMKRWIGSLESPINEAEAHLNNAGSVNVDIARMKIENATLKESLDSMEHLTSAVRRLRLSLSKNPYAAEMTDCLHYILFVLVPCVASPEIDIGQRINFLRSGSKKWPLGNCK